MGRSSLSGMRKAIASHATLLTPALFVSLTILLTLASLVPAMGAVRDIPSLDIEEVPGKTLRVPSVTGRFDTIPQTAVAGETLVAFEAGVSPAQVADIAAQINCVVNRKLPGSNLYVIGLPAATNVVAGASMWKGQPGVAAADPNYICIQTAIPTDPLYGMQWHWQNINAQTAWDFVTGDPSLVIAIVDSGVDRNHPDLASRIWTNVDEAAGTPGVDDDGNGFVDDEFGWDFINDNNDPNPYAGGVQDGNDHGTHVAGIAGAAANNGEGGVGHDWAAQLMGLQCLDAGGSGPLDAIIDAFNYAVNNGADIINLSLISSYTDLWDIPIQTAVLQGVTVVAAAGNFSEVMDDNAFSWYSPVCNDGAFLTDNRVLGVGAVGDDDTVAYYSNLDASSRSFVDVMAPGGDLLNNRGILSTIPDDPASGFIGFYSDQFQGTSMASPVVAGLAALVKARFPAAGPAQIMAQIVAGCDNIDALNPLNVGQMGAGRVNSGNSMGDLPPAAPGSISAFDTPDDEGGSTTVVWSKSADDGRNFDDVTGYDVLRSDVGNTGPFNVEAALLPPGTTIYQDLNVVDGMSYWYKVAVHDASNVVESAVAGPAIPIDDLAPPPIANLTATDTIADNGGSITLNWSGYTAPADFTRYNVYRAEASFDNLGDPGVTQLTPFPLLTSPSNQVWADTTAVDGTQYWYAVTAVDEIPNENPNVNAAGPAVSSPNFTFSYPPGMTMIAIGADTPETDLAALLGVAPQDLRAGRWNPATESYHRYQDNPGDPYLQHQLGRSFWLVSDDPILRSIAGQPAPVGDFTVGVEEGWNMLGNPYTANIELENYPITVEYNGQELTLGGASALGWVRDYMWSYDPFLESYILVTTNNQFRYASGPQAGQFFDWTEQRVRKGRGVFFRSFVPANINMARPPTAALPTQVAENAQPGLAGADWQIALVADGPAGADLANFVGVSEAAASLNSVLSPPPQGIDLYFENEPGVRAAASFSKPGAAPADCKFKVQTTQVGPVSLKWPDLSTVPAEIRPVLVDAAANREVYMRTATGYTYDGDPDTIAAFSIEFRTADNGALAVRTMTAASAGRGAQVVFTLSKDASATVDIVNIAGRSVRRLAAGVAVDGGEATTLSWDGRNSAGTLVPSGRYIVRLTAAAGDGQTVSAASALSIRR